MYNKGGDYMSIEERKKDLYDYLAHLEKEIEVLKCNIVEFKSLIEKAQSEIDVNNLVKFDLERGITMFELF